MRRPIAMAVVVLHGMLLLLLALGLRIHVDREPVWPEFVSAWITPPAPAQPVQPQSPAPIKAMPRRVPPESLRSEPIALPETAPRVDWTNEALLAARRAVGKHGMEEQKEGFSPPPKSLKAPCKPKAGSMEWNGRDDRKVGLAGGIFPYVKLGNCVVGLGFFGCSGGSEPNSHLLDDMKDPDRSRNAVPDADKCD